MRPSGTATITDEELFSTIHSVSQVVTNERVRATFQEGTNLAGGYTVPSILMTGFLEGLVPASSVLNVGARLIPLDAGA